MIVAVLKPHDMIPTLDALRSHFEAIRRAELTRLERKLARLPPEARTCLDEITRLIVDTLLLTPTEHLRSLNDGPTRARYAATLNRVFQLAVEADDAVDDLETTVSTG
jgi:glutamyl-tRNA reductase